MKKWTNPYPDRFTDNEAGQIEEMIANDADNTKPLTSKEILSKLTTSKRELVIKAYDLLVKPEFNGGHYLSPSEWNNTCNAILGTALGEKLNLSGNVLNAVMKRIGV